MCMCRCYNAPRLGRCLYNNTLFFILFYLMWHRQSTGHCQWTVGREAQSDCSSALVEAKKGAVVCALLCMWPGLELSESEK